ncbi:MAG: hypothetical protein HYT79_07115 [Elusimicrobia bacterium]|nr:hypothetical protein [Elusimicrobiota bacterium]
MLNRAIIKFAAAALILAGGLPAKGESTAVDLGSLLASSVRKNEVTGRFEWIGSDKTINDINKLLFDPAISDADAAYGVEFLAHHLTDEALLNEITVFNGLIYLRRAEAFQSGAVLALAGIANCSKTISCAKTRTPESIAAALKAIRSLKMIYILNPHEEEINTTRTLINARTGAVITVDESDIERFRVYPDDFAGGLREIGDAINDWALEAGDAIFGKPTFENEIRAKIKGEMMGILISEPNPLIRSAATAFLKDEAPGYIDAAAKVRRDVDVWAKKHGL